MSRECGIEPSTGRGHLSAVGTTAAVYWVASTGSPSRPSVVPSVSVSVLIGDQRELSLVITA